MANMAPIPGQLDHKIAIVTGGASGIGRAICLRFAHEGASVVVADRQPQSTAAAEVGEGNTADLITQRYGDRRSRFMECDVTKASDLDDVVRNTVKEFGRLDIMVNNAGISIESTYSHPIWEFEEDHLLDRTLDVNVKGVFYGIRAAARQMRTQAPFSPPTERSESGSANATVDAPIITHPKGSRGWIINIGSLFGLVGCAQASCYVAAKHAVHGLTKSAALDCAPELVHVNAICPGFIYSSLISQGVAARPEAFQMAGMMHPWAGGGLGTPEDVVGVAVFLASDAARWMTGACVSVDGGYSTQ